MASGSGSPEANSAEEDEDADGVARRVLPTPPQNALDDDGVEDDDEKVDDHDDGVVEGENPCVEDGSKAAIANIIATATIVVTIGGGGGADDNEPKLVLRRVILIVVCVFVRVGLGIFLLSFVFLLLFVAPSLLAGP